MTFRFVLNPRVDRAGPYPDALKTILSRALRADLTEQLARRVLALRDECPRPTQSA